MPVVQRAEGRDDGQANDPVAGTLIAMNQPCDRCHIWHRADWTCFTALKVDMDDRAEQDKSGPNPCVSCKNVHPKAITCYMYPEWRAWQDEREFKTAAIWRETIFDAWDVAESVRRLDNAISLIDRTEGATRKADRCQPPMSEG